MDKRTDMHVAVRVGVPLAIVGILAIGIIIFGLVIFFVIRKQSKRYTFLLWLYSWLI